MLYMKKEWGNLNRVRLGQSKHYEGKPTWAEVFSWCGENLHDNYFTSDGHECFYFKSYKDAIFFKLRWFDYLFSN